MANRDTTPKVPAFDGILQIQIGAHEISKVHRRRSYSIFRVAHYFDCAGYIESLPIVQGEVVRH